MPFHTFTVVFFGLLVLWSTVASIYRCLPLLTVTSAQVLNCHECLRQSKVLLEKVKAGTGGKPYRNTLDTLTQIATMIQVNPKPSTLYPIPYTLNPVP